MIIDIPTENEFVEAGLDYLNFAWDSSIQLLVDIEEGLIDKNPQEYLDSSQRKLQSAIALIHQGIELILKGKIVHVSPFLLISSKPDNWPKSCAQQNISFSEFRTIDAQDLVKVVNTVHSHRLPDKFVTLFNQLRGERNKVIHSVGPNSILTPIAVIELILDVFGLLLPSLEWLHIRACYTSEQSSSYFGELAHENDVSLAYSLGILQREFSHVIKSLSPSKVKNHFNFDKKKKSFICSNCESMREKEHFFELKNEEWFYLESAYWVSKELGEAYCFYCKNNAKIEVIE